MLFTSYGFIFFLVAVVAAYYLMPKNHQWKLLLAASFLFYGLSGAKYLLYIIATMLTVYVISRKMDALRVAAEESLRAGNLSKTEKKALRVADKARRFKWLLLCLGINFGILAVVKYTDFVILNINVILRACNAQEWAFFRFALPMGISFYTFQSMGYMIDVYRGKYPAEQNLGKLALFVSFFPQVIQGPISRFDDLQVTLFAPHPFDGKNIAFGLQRILLGFFKKLVIADRLLPAVKAIVGDTGSYQGVYVLLGVFFYAVTLYADFTGGIDITIGAAETLGIKLKENFDRPFYSKSIAEYWRRWHITMGTWFRDYVFYPLSVCKPMLKLSTFSREKWGGGAGKKIPVYVSTLIVWFATGLWHGASWNFIVWGLLNGVVIIISQECTPLYARFHARFKVGSTWGYQAFQIVRTFWLMSFIRMLDCYRDVGTTFHMYGTVVSNLSLRQLFTQGLTGLGLQAEDYMVVALAVGVLLVISYLKRQGGHVRVMLAESAVCVRYGILLALFFAIILFGAYGVGYDANQFIYNQF